MLISETTMKSLLNYNYRNDYYFYCYFGESKIFVSINDSKYNKYLIEIYYLDQNNCCILPEAIYKFNNENNLLSTLSLLRVNGYYQFVQQHLMFTENVNDFVSPIFDKNNKEDMFINIIQI